MTFIITTQVQENKSTPRVWLDSRHLVRVGFDTDTTYNVLYGKDQIVLVRDASGQRKVTMRRGNAVIDLNNQKVGDIFPLGTKLRAVIRKGKVIIKRLVQTVKTYAREARLLNKLATGQPLSVVSIFHGGGVMSKALHKGLTDSGIKSTVSVAVEVERKYLDASISANPELFTENTTFINAPVQSVPVTGQVECDIIEAGIPCTGASSAGRAKGKLAHAESHADAGAMFFSVLQYIQNFQPAIVIMENVKAYRSTASMEIIRNMLGSWDYDLMETVLNGHEFGALENRDRLVVVAVSKGLEGVMDSLNIRPVSTAPANVATILEPIAENDDLWGEYSYLAKKEERDIAAGKGFRRQLIEATSATVPTVTREYQKARSTDPFLRHPTNPNLSRLFTAIEHGRIKGLPEGYVESLGVAKTTAHEILGQGVVFPKFEAVGAAVGRALMTLQAANNGSPAQQNTNLVAVA